MNSKIHVEQFGTIHYHAVCESCDFSPAIFADGLETPQAVRNEVYKHIRATGHAVNVESGKSTRYSAVPAS